MEESTNCNQCPVAPPELNNYWKTYAIATNAFAIVNIYGADKYILQQNYE